MNPQTLADIRQTIDGLDATIMDALSQRFALMQQVKAEKQRLHVPTFDAKREQSILEKLKMYAYPEQLEAIYQLIFQLAKELQT
jgi:chorismate mutase